MSTGWMKGQIFSGTNEIRVVVPAVYVSEAEEKIKRLYGASHVWNIDECDENGRTHYDRKPSSGGSSSIGESLGTLGFLAGVIGIIAFWETILIVALVGAVGTGGFYGLGVYLNWKEEQDKIKAEKEANKNRPAQVSHKYRTEAFK